MEAPGTASVQIASGNLPERQSVYWRRPVDERSLRRSGRLWTATTVAHTVPFVTAAMLITGVAALVTIPVSLILLAHAWIIPELYASRGANVLRDKTARKAPEAAQRRALGLLGDLVDHRARELLARTGLLLEPGRFGVWLIGEAGAVLVRGRRVYCYCVRVAEPDLPRGDRIAHLLLALRADESGFATVANLAFSGAGWRLRRRLPAERREALAEARRLAAPS
jgi:hypothetical protein